MTSSVFIRHTMKTLYSGLRVEMRRLVVHTPPSTASQSRKREKSVFVGLSVYGTTRVSGGLGEWHMWVVRLWDGTRLMAGRDSTYDFSPVSGQINLHTLDSILPAPHQAAYDALWGSLGHMGPGSTDLCILHN